MSQQSVRQAARRSALDAQAARRKERADRERRLEGLAANVLTALGERDGAVRDAERRAGEALQTMTIDEGLSPREAVAWCGSGALTVREVTRLCQLAQDPQAAAADEPRDASGYLDFDRAVLTQEVTGRTWSALCDPTSAVHGLVANGEDQLAGLAHLILHPTM